MTYSSPSFLLTADILQDIHREVKRSSSCLLKTLKNTGMGACSDAKSKSLLELGTFVIRLSGLFVQVSRLFVALLVHRGRDA